MSDDDWEWMDEPVNLMMGSASPGGMAIEEGDDPMDLRGHFLYVPDLTARMGYAVHRVRDRTPKPQVRVRRAGFRMRRKR